MEAYLPHIILACALGAIALATLAWFNRRKIEEVTTESLLKAAQAAVDEAQRLADLRARAIADDQAALAADLDRISKARARIAGNVPAASVA